MMRRNELSKVGPVSLFAAALLLAPDQAEAGEYRTLCTSASKACVYTGPNAPVLRAEVCWNGYDVRLKGSNACAAGSWPYYVDFGEVIDPVAGLVLAYIPLDDACDMGFCVGISDVDGPFTAEPLCCNPAQDDCVLQVQGSCENTIVFCEQAATNDDGTISCHDSAS